MNRAQRRAAKARAFKNPLRVTLLPFDDPQSEARAAAILGEQRRLLLDPTLSEHERASLVAAEQRALNTWRLFAMLGKAEPSAAAS